MTIFFLHIPKAGGSTFSFILNKMYSMGEVIDLYTPGPDWDSILTILKKRKDDKNISLVKGHFFYGIHNFLPDNDYQYITFMRNPVSRIISFFNFIKESDLHFLHHQLKNGMRLSDFIMSDLTWEIDNCMIRQITGKKDLSEKCSEDSLKEAQQIIEKDFSFVGITEYFDESLVLLKNLLNWDEYPFYKKINVTKNREKSADVKTIKKISERNELDIKLYNWALEKFDKEKINCINFDHQLAALKECNSAYRRGYELGYKNGQNVGFSKGAQFYKNKLFTKYPLLSWLNRLKSKTGI